MRSDVVNVARTAEGNRFVLCQLVNKTVRKFHKPTRDRIQDSLNDAFLKVAHLQYGNHSAEEVTEP